MINGEAHFEEQSLDDLMSHDLPRSIDNITLMINDWSATREITRTISISLSSYRSDCFVSASDELWFKGKIQQLEEFKKRVTPWYGKFHFRTLFPSLAGAIAGILIARSYQSFDDGHYVVSLLYFGCITALALIWWSAVMNRVFPRTLIYIQQHESWNNERLMLAFTIITAVGTLVLMIIELAK